MQTTPTTVSKFVVDGVLFDMDGTLTDSIAAVEAAWTAKANELGLEPEAVIKATHGRRASDNLMELVPGLRKHQVNDEVEKFEQSILDFADTPPLSQRTTPKSTPPASRRASSSSARRPSTTKHRASSGVSSGTLSSLAPMTPVEDNSRRESAVRFDTMLSKLSERFPAAIETEDSPFEEELETEEEMVDMSVRILPGVRNVINSLPEHKYAVATSGAKTYCHGCLERVGIKIPKVCVTADDPRLKRGKPFPDPFLLAAADLGFNPKKTVIFEDSPSGIKAAVAAGGIVIAVCTSHKREQIHDLGAHYVIDTMEQVKISQNGDGTLAFEVTA